MFKCNHTFSTPKSILLTAAFMGFLGVALGAFAAHGLKGHMTPYDLSVFQTGVQYQQMHTLALLFAVLGLWFLPSGKASCLLGWSAVFWILGILLFSGSLYALVLTQTPSLGMITPVGGGFFMLGWLCLFFAALKLPIAKKQHG